MAKPKIIYVNKLIVDGKLLKEWQGKRIPKWMLSLQNLCGVRILTEEIQLDGKG